MDRICSAGLSSAQPDSALGLTSGVGAGGQALHAVEAGLDERSVELGLGDGLVGIGHAERAESAVARLAGLAADDRGDLGPLPAPDEACGPNDVPDASD